MMFTKEQLGSLRDSVKVKLSERRYLHTLGVVRAAVKIAGAFDDIDVSEISVAAYLHDISKEYSEAEQKVMLSECHATVSEEDLRSPQVLHSLTAPYVIMRDYAEFATDNVLSAVYNHTLGASDMSLFDEIIFIADYIEDGRSYPSCISVREKLYSTLYAAGSRQARLASLHTAVFDAASATVDSVIKSGGHLHERTLATRDAFSVLLDSMKG